MDERSRAPRARGAVSGTMGGKGAAWRLARRRAAEKRPRRRVEPERTAEDLARQGPVVAAQALAWALGGFAHVDA
jgi:hypothetical protein